MALAPTAAITADDELASLKQELLLLPIILLPIELNLRSQVRVKRDVLNCCVRLTVANTDSCDDLVFRHLKTAFKLLTSIRTECSRVHTVFEVQLNRTDGVINSTSDSMEKTFGQLQGLVLTDAQRHISGITELKSASFLAAKGQLSQITTLILVQTTVHIAGLDGTTVAIDLSH